MSTQNAMRLSDRDQNLIMKVVRSYDSNARVYLFGSRVDDTKKGGDLDLLILTETLDASHKLDLLIQLKGHLGEQKIDLLIKTHSEYSKDIFCQSLNLVEIK